MKIELSIESSVLLHLQFSKALMTSKWINKCDQWALSSATITMVSQMFQSSTSTTYWLWRHLNKIDDMKASVTSPSRTNFQLERNTTHGSLWRHNNACRGSFQGEYKTIAFFITLLRRDNIYYNYILLHDIIVDFSWKLFNCTNQRKINRGNIK